MKNIWKILISLIILWIFIQKGFACMPHTKQEIIIGTFEREYEGDFPKKWFYENTEEVIAKYIDFSWLEKPFAKFYKKIWKYFFYDFKKLPKSYKREHWTKIINLDGFKKGDKIIMVSDYQDWDFEDYYTISAIAKLKCDWKNLKITNAKWYNITWEKSMWQCGNYKPKNVFSKKELLEKLEEKYNFCKESKKEEKGEKKQSFFEKISNFFTNLF